MKRDQTLHHLVVESGDGEINALDNHEDEAFEWCQVISYVDSGAGKSVCPIEHCDEVPVVSSRGSRSGEHFTTASGVRLPNQGDRTITGVDDRGTPLELKYAVADVTTALDSVAKICDAGNRVIFDKWGGYIAGGKGRVDFKRVDDSYVRTTWVRRPRKPKKNPTAENEKDEEMPQASALTQKTDGKTQNKAMENKRNDQGFGRPGPRSL